MQAMQSLLISAHQVLNKMTLTENVEYYESDKIRAYLKTEKGIFHKELIGDCKEDKFLMMLFNNLCSEIAKVVEKKEK